MSPLNERNDAKYDVYSTQASNKCKRALISEWLAINVPLQACYSYDSKKIGERWNQLLRREGNELFWYDEEAGDPRKVHPVSTEMTWGEEQHGTEVFLLIFSEFSRTLIAFVRKIIKRSSGPRELVFCPKPIGLASFTKLQVKNNRNRKMYSYFTWSDLLHDQTYENSFICNPILAKMKNKSVARRQISSHLESPSTLLEFHEGTWNEMSLYEVRCNHRNRSSAFSPSRVETIAQANRWADTYAHALTMHRQSAFCVENFKKDTEELEWSAPTSSGRARAESKIKCSMQHQLWKQRMREVNAVQQTSRWDSSSQITVYSIRISPSAAQLLCALQETDTFEAHCYKVALHSFSFILPSYSFTSAPTKPFTSKSGVLMAITSNHKLIPLYYLSPQPKEIHHFSKMHAFYIGQVIKGGIF